MSIILIVAIGRDLWNVHAQQLHLWHLKDFTLPQTKAFTAAYIAGLTATCFTLATVITFIHQVIIHRVTLALFRLYVAGVSFGVGFVFFVPTFFLLSAKSPNPAFQTAAMVFALIAALASAIGLAHFCFCRSGQFRGDYPRNFPLVSRDEFDRAV